ncbi:MFS transporter [Marisediminicola sp. LYQ134]|uniref:MFS transporter n=1 Tax=Marisediminicola sp. LYQ134 TaxID=3391061 RepID=UPI003982E81C
MRYISFSYLLSYGLSLLGNSIAAVALPLLVLQTTGSALATGTVALASAVPAAVAGLLMGVVIDRLDRRFVSVFTDIVSAASLAALPLIDASIGLSLGWFVASAVIGSFGDIPGMTARETMLPVIARDGALGAERLVGIRESLGAVVLLIGPAIAATLIVLLDPASVLWITAGTSALAAVVTLTLPRDPRRARRGVSAERARLRDGVVALIRSRFLVATTVLTVLAAVALSGLQGLVLPVYFTMAEQPHLLGFVLSSLAAGLLLGSGLYAGLHSRVPRRVWFVTGAALLSVGMGVIATLASPAVIFVGASVTGLGSGLFSSLLGVLMIERIPDALRGRIMSTQNVALTVAPGLGIVAVAVVTEGFGVHAAALGVAALIVVTSVFGIVSPALRTLEPPTEEQG